MCVIRSSLQCLMHSNFSIAKIAACCQIETVQVYEMHFKLELIALAAMLLQSCTID